MLFRTIIILFCIFLTGCSSNISRNISIIGTPPSTDHIMQGKGRPAVIFESGLGDHYNVWRSVIAGVSQITKVYAYNRNSSSNSDAGSEFTTAKTSRDIAAALRARLGKAGIKPPYILAGHSYGGLYILKYAEMYPKEVAGIVLVDGRPAQFTQSCNRLNLGNCSIPFLLQSLQAPHDKLEIRGIPETEDTAPLPSSFGTTPITVIASTVPPTGYSKKYQAHWITMQRNFAETLKNGRFVSALGARHKIHKDRPGIVIQEIRNMLEKVKR